HYQQQLDDLALAREAQRDEARHQYGLDRDELAEELNLTGAQLEDAYAAWILQAQLAAAKAAAAIASAWQSEISRYQQYLPYGPSPEVERYRQYQTTTPRPPILVAQQGALGQWSIPGSPMFQMAEGGVIHATSPTTVMMGEGGPETGYFVPGGAGGGLFEHRFGGRVGVDFGGLPAGLNTQQVQGIVNETVIKLVKSVKIPRA
ncbi:MAG: hypothetical protein KKC55_15035, partial [Gammaproteobacteria bacterium]|nr:hypothetical protein [Gammaproteobacteria bacterium]